MSLRSCCCLGYVLQGRRRRRSRDQTKHGGQQLVSLKQLQAAAASDLFLDIQVQVEVGCRLEDAMASSRDHHPSYKFVPLAPAPGPSQQSHHPVATVVEAAYNGMDSDDSGGGKEVQCVHMTCMYSHSTKLTYRESKHLRS